MLAQFGLGVFVLTFLLAVFSVGAAVAGYFSKSDRWVETARLAMRLTFPLITLGVLALTYLLVTGHYELQYVYSVTSNSMPFYLKVTALWGGQAGSLVLWSWLMSAFASAVTLRKWERDRDLLPWVIVVTSITLAFFLSLSILYENPFARWWQTSGGEFVAAHVCASRCITHLSCRRSRFESAAAPSRHDHSPPAVIPGVRCLRNPIRICHCSPGYRPL